MRDDIYGCRACERRNAESTEEKHLARRSRQQETNSQATPQEDLDLALCGHWRPGRYHARPGRDVDPQATGRSEGERRAAGRASGESSTARAAAQGGRQGGFEDPAAGSIVPSVEANDPPGWGGGSVSGSVSEANR